MYVGYIVYGFVCMYVICLCLLSSLCVYTVHECYVCMQCMSVGYICMSCVYVLVVRMLRMYVMCVYVCYVFNGVYVDYGMRV